LALKLIYSFERQTLRAKEAGEARAMRREEFKSEVDRYLSGKDTEPWEILYFKDYKSQLPAIEQALELAGLMLGSDKLRVYCLEMICADFVAVVSFEAGNRNALLPCLSRLVIGLPKPQQKQLLENVQVTLWLGSEVGDPACGLPLNLIVSSAVNFGARRMTVPIVRAYRRSWGPSHSAE
jgi:hypothetical protein